MHFFRINNFARKTKQNNKSYQKQQFLDHFIPLYIIFCFQNNYL